MTIRAVVFDLGHTLWDIGDAGDSLERAYHDARATLSMRLGRDDLPSGDEIRAAVTQALHESAETYFMQSPRLEQPATCTWVEAGCRSLGLELDEELLLEITPPLFATEVERLVCHEGTCETVAELRDAGYRIGCITNTLADTPTIRRMLRLHGLEDVMRSVVVSSDEGWRKPHQSLFEKALRELDVPANEAVFVGDSPWHDIGGAKAVGMYAVLTTQYVARDYEGFEPPPDAIIHHVRELRDVVRRLSGG